MNTFKSFDAFAKPLTLNIKGKRVQGSKVGGLCTLIMTALFVWQLAILLIKYVDSTDPVSNQYDIVRDVANIGPYLASEINFDLAVGLISTA